MLQVEEVELVDKKGYLTLCITLAKDGKVLLRKPEGIRDWFQDIKVRDQKERRFSFLSLQVLALKHKSRTLE